MKKQDKSFKIVTGTLILLIIAVAVNHYVYPAFSIAHTGMVYRYDLELWKRYFAWWPGKILCLTIAISAAALLIETLFLILYPRKK